MFGKSYLLDCYGVSSEKCDSLELNYRFAEQLVDKIKMTLFGSIIVIHGPRINGKEVYEDKSGITLFAPLIESSIVLHTLSQSGFISLDVYSCKEFDPKIVWDFTHEVFEFTKYEHTIVKRGINYFSN